VGVTVAGTLNFNDCDGLSGSGAVSGKKWCDDGGDHPLYAIVAESKSLAIGDMLISDIVLSATATSAATVISAATDGSGATDSSAATDSSGDVGVVWAFVFSGTLDYSESSSIKAPSLGAAATLAIRARASSSPVGGFLFEELLLSGSMSYTTKEISVGGSFEIEYPCQPGGFADVNLSFAMTMSSVSVDGVEARAKLYCEPPADFPLLSLDLKIDRIEVKGFKISDVEVHVDMYSTPRVGDDFNITDERAVSSNLTFKGSMSGSLEVALEGMEAGTTVALSFDTESKSFHVTVALQISVPPVTLDLQVGFSGGTGCDSIKGDFLYGGITIKLSEDSQLSGSVRGAKHCESHPQMMHALGAVPPKISPKYDAIAEFLDSDWEKSLTQVELERMFPMYTIHGTVSATEIAPGLFLKSATISVYNYDINGTQFWAFEVAGSVTFKPASGAANPALQPKPAGLAAALYVALSGYSDDAGLLDYGLGVKASVDATFGGGAVSVNLKGSLAFAFPCENVKGDMKISLSDLGAGIDAQTDIAVSATVACAAIKTAHARVMHVKGSLAGMISNDIAVVDRLDIEASLHNNANSDGLYLVATIVGEATPVTVVPGLKISAQLVANTSVPRFSLEVGLQYHSEVLDAELNGTVHLPLASCRAGNAMSLRGKITVHLSGGDIAAAAAGSKICDRHASDVYGYTYAVSFALDKTDIEVGGGLTLSVEELAAEFYGKVIGSSSAGGSGTLSWFGSLNASISLSSLSGSGMVPQSLVDAGEGTEVSFSAALLMKHEAVKLTLVVGFSYKSDVISFDGEGMIPLAAENGAALKPTGLSAKGTFELKMGSGIDISLEASFSLLMEPKPEDGRDMSVSLTSGIETIKVGGVDLGAFTMSADRFAAVQGSKSGWRGVMTSANPLLATMAVFDTRDGSVEVITTITLDMGAVTLELSAAALCKSAGTVKVSASVVLKAYPEARLTGAYIKYCTETAELDWSVTARVAAWNFASGISLTDVDASFHMRKEGGLLITIQATVDFAAGAASPMALPSLTALITIDGGDMSMSITGDVAIYIDAVTLSGKVSFVFPCQPGGSNFVELGIAIDSDEIKLDHAKARGEWMCPGDDLPTNAKLSKYSASIGLMQVGSFALVDVMFEMHNLKSKPDAYRGKFQGTFDIIPGQLSVTVVVPFGEPVVTYEILVDAKLQIGDVNVALTGSGKLKSVCENMGDLYISVEAKVTNIPVSWMSSLTGRGTFSSNCGDEFLLLIEIEFGDDGPKLSVGYGIALAPPPGTKISFGVHSVPGTATFSVSFTMPLGDEGMSMSVFADVLSTGAFNLGVSIQDITFAGIFSAIGAAFPGSDTGGSNPMAGSALAAAEGIGAALGQGHNLDDDQVASLGGFGVMLNLISIKKVLAMLSLLPDGSLALTVSLYGMKMFGMSMEAFVHLLKEGEGGRWTALAYIGLTDIEGGYLDFPFPFNFLSAAINVGVFIMGGGLTSLGFSYASDNMVVRPQIKEYCPVDLHYVRGRDRPHCLLKVYLYILAAAPSPSRLIVFRYSLAASASSSTSSTSLRRIAHPYTLAASSPLCRWLAHSFLFHLCC